MAQASDENSFLGQVRLPMEKTMGKGQSALWTLPLVATQYQSLQPSPAMKAALQAQYEGRFLDAQILLGEDGADAELLRSSFLLQGNQPRQALENLAPMLEQTQHAADAYALTAMARLQQGQMQEALIAANHAHDLNGGILPHLALSYALQGNGRLAEAREVMHGFNAQTPPSAISLAREAELALTLAQTRQAKILVNRALETEPEHPYVIAVSGLVYLIDGHAQEARGAFETALKRDPKDARASLGLGLAEIKLGNFQTGQEKLRAADEADPDNALILTYLGRSQQQFGQTGAARESYRRAQLADPKDPVPWLYQAQAELQGNRPLEARASLLEAQERTAYRKVYRGENLLHEDEQLLQANLAEAQRQLGMENLAFHTLADSASEKNSASLRNQADILQGQRFGESARRSLMLQSLFNERPGNLQSILDIYGDGAWQTGASTPQHGPVNALSVLGAQQTSYNNFDELFSRRTTLEADATTGSQNTNGEQIRLGTGNDTLGLSIAQRQFKTDGFAPFENLDNRVEQAIVQWRPTLSTQAFVSYQTLNSRHGETIYPTDPAGYHAAIEDNSRITRLGLRHSLTVGSELRGLLSLQQTDQAVDYNGLSIPPNHLFTAYGGSDAHSEELQYRNKGATHATQWGVQQTRGRVNYWYSFPYSFGFTQNAQQLYAAWQQELNPQWQLDAGLGLGKIDNQFGVALAGQNTSLARWLPKLGMVYTPDSGMHLRVAAWQGMDAHAVGDATLAPASLAGFLLNRPSDNGQLVHSIALGGDSQLGHDWLLDAQVQKRKTDLPTIDPDRGRILIWQRVDESRLALHWQPQDKPFAVSLSYADERIQNDPSAIVTLDSIDEQTLRQQQLALKWFASAKCAVNLAWSHNQVFGTQKFLDYSLPAPYISILSVNQNGFDQLDFDLSWKFDAGLLVAGARNAADTRFQYTEIDPLNPRFSNGRLTYAKLKLAL